LLAKTTTAVKLATATTLSYSCRRGHVLVISRRDPFRRTAPEAGTAVSAVSAAAAD